MSVPQLISLTEKQIPKKKIITLQHSGKTLRIVTLHSQVGGLVFMGNSQVFANCSKSDRGCLSNDIRHTVESRGKLVIKSEGGRLGNLHHVHASLCQGTGEVLALCLIAWWTGTELMKGVVKRWPRERSCAGWNLWCYLFCALIAAFNPSNFICSLWVLLWFWGCGLLFGFSGFSFVLFWVLFICFVGGCCCCCCFSPKKITAGFLASEFTIVSLKKMGHFQVRGDLDPQFGSRSDLAQSRTVSKSGLGPNGGKLCLWTCHSLRCSVHFEFLAMSKCWAEVIGPHVVRN